MQNVCPDEQLVCYFEDCSFSVVPKSAMVPFSPETEPYLSYARSIKRFLNDSAVILATNYWYLGEIPENFKWLRLLELGYCEKEGSFVAGGGKRRGPSSSHASFVDVEEELLVDLKNSDQIEEANYDDGEDEEANASGIEQESKRSKAEKPPPSTPKETRQKVNSGDIYRPSKGSTSKPMASAKKAVTPSKHLRHPINGQVGRPPKKTPSNKQQQQRSALSPKQGALSADTDFQQKPGKGERSNAVLKRKPFSYELLKPFLPTPTVQLWKFE